MHYFAHIGRNLWMSRLRISSVGDPETTPDMDNIDNMDLQGIQGRNHDNYSGNHDADNPKALHDENEEKAQNLELPPPYSIVENIGDEKNYERKIKLARLKARKQHITMFYRLEKLEKYWESGRGMLWK